MNRKQAKTAKAQEKQSVNDDATNNNFDESMIGNGHRSGDQKKTHNLRDTRQSISSMFSGKGKATNKIMNEPAVRGPGHVLEDGTAIPASIEDLGQH